MTRTRPDKWKIDLALCWLAQFLCIVGFQASFPFLPFFIRELGVTDPGQITAWAGVMAAGGSIAMAVVSPIWGLLADRRGRKMMVMRATFGGVVITTATAFAANVQQLFVLRLIQGLLTGTVSAFMTLVASFTPACEMGFALGLMQMAVYAGLSAGPFLGGMLADQIGYRAVFLVTAGLLLVSGLLVQFLVHEDFHRPEKQESDLSARSQVRAFFHSWPVMGAAVALALIYLGNSVTSPILPLQVESLQSNAALLNTSTGSIYGVTALASALASVFIGRLSDRRGYRRVLIFCCAGTALGYLGQGFSNNLGLLIATSALAGLFMGGTIPTSNALLSKVTPAHQRGMIFGLSNSINAGGRAIGPLLGAALANGLGLRSSFFCAGVVFLVVIVWIWTAVQERSSTTEGDAA